MEVLELFPNGVNGTGSQKERKKEVNASYQMNKKTLTVTELERRKEVILWQISIAKDPKVIIAKQERFKQLQQQIKELTE